MNTALTRELDLNTLTLKAGKHPTGTGMCLMEAVAYIAGENWTDHPTCASPVLAAYGRALNDGMNAQARQLLKPLIPRLVGTAGNPELDTRRAYLATNRMLHVSMPNHLESCGKHELAARLRTIPDIIDAPTAQHARKIARQARTDAAAAAADAVADAVAVAAAAAAADAAAAAAAADDAMAAWQPSIDLFIDMIELT